MPFVNLNPLDDCRKPMKKQPAVVPDSPLPDVIATPPVTTGLSVIRVPLDSLTEDPANVNQHPERSITAIAGSLKRFGQVEPLVVHRGIVIGGNGRLRAMRQLGWTHCDVHEYPGTKSEATALAIALNRSAQFSEFDDAALLRQLDALADEGFDLDVDLGFSEEELAELAGEEPVVPTGDDAEPRVSEKDILAQKWGTGVGQLWELGRHRLLCGDSAQRVHVDAVLRGDRPTVIFTDPPYGVSIGHKNETLNTFHPSGRCLESLASDDLSPDQLAAYLLPAFENIRDTMADDATVFVCSPQVGELSMMMMMMMQNACLRPRHVLVWKKNQPTFSINRLDYDYQHEPILMTWGQRHKRLRNGLYQTSVWEVDKPRTCDVHPTMKPVDLYINAYLNHSDHGDITFDPYCGSGTAIIASEQVGRACRAIEIDPGFAAVILQRFMDATGTAPVLLNPQAVPPSPPAPPPA